MTTQMKTKWFTGHDKPAHIGWYECKNSVESFFDWWNGTKWESFPGADDYSPESQNHCQWRGLSEPCNRGRDDL